MTDKNYGTGGVVSSSEFRRLCQPFGPWQAPLDFNRASLTELSHILGRTAAAAVNDLRRQRPIEDAHDLAALQIIAPERLSALAAAAYGARPARPLLTGIRVDDRCYVGEPFTISFDFTPGSLLKPEILSLAVRFPSGRTHELHRRVDAAAAARGSMEIGPFVSGEAGEFFILATLRDEAGGIHRLGADCGVFTRNPVQLYIRPSHWTQSGRAGAPKFDFGARNWTCFADVRWVNGTNDTVNLGRRVTVRVTDVGNEIETFSFDLSGDIVLAPWSTVYGNLYTSHGEGNAVFNIFHNKGDLIYKYQMNGSGHLPTDNQIWRTMRVIGFNIIRVGDFTAAERNEYRRAAGDVASAIHQSRDMTVYGVELYRIEGTPAQDADKTRFRFLDSEQEFKDMARRYSVDNWYLDVFMVEGAWNGALGMTYSDGPVDKRGDLSGIAIPRDGDTVNLGQSFAHEAGHYLGLEHANEDDGIADTDPADPNISDNFIYSSSRRDSTVVTPGQSGRMRRHGLVRSMTP